MNLCPTRGEAFIHTILEMEDPTSLMKGIAVSAKDLSDTPEDGHVLFMDLVCYSKLPMDEQRSLIRKLFELVRETPEFQRAQSGNQLIRLPTGDGMALVFFQNPLARAVCVGGRGRAEGPSGRKVKDGHPQRAGVSGARHKRKLQRRGRRD